MKYARRISKTKIPKQAESSMSEQTNKQSETQIANQWNSKVEDFDSCPTYERNRYIKFWIINENLRWMCVWAEVMRWRWRHMLLSHKHTSTSLSLSHTHMRNLVNIQRTFFHFTHASPRLDDTHSKHVWTFNLPTVRMLYTHGFVL